MSAVQQDGAVRHIPGRLGILLTLIRALVGRRGWAQVTWHGQGFTYTLYAVRDPYADPEAILIDADVDEDGLGGDRGPFLGDLAQLLEVEP